MNKIALEVNKLNLKNMRSPYITTGVIFLFMLILDSVKLLTAYGSGQMMEQILVSIGNLLWLLIPLAAIQITGKNFHSLINLGCQRDHFFFGSLNTYVALSGIVSLANTLIYYSYDHFINSTGFFEGILNCIELFGWSSNGPIIAFIQQFAFLLFIAAVIHTLALMQDNWIGWVTDSVIAVVLIFFLSVDSLRIVFLHSLNLIIFNSNVVLQILTCLILAALIYSCSLLVLKRKRL